MAEPVSQNELTPSVIVIFGITGDLAQRKLLPALYHLVKEGLLHEKTVILGTTRRAVSAEELLKQTELCVLEANNVCDPAALKLMEQKLSMFQMDMSAGEDFDRLRDKLEAIETEQGICLNRLYYLAIPPQVYGSIVQQLGSHGLNSGCPHNGTTSRLLVEKPFGYDLTSASELIETLTAQFEETQIYRIDHYLARETTQNIMAFRFNNPLFADLWNRRHITDITVTASEKIDIEGRAGFYDAVGALRDFIQSHLLQLLAVTTMEAPADSSAAAIQAARLALLQSIEPVPADQVTEQSQRGQYEGYRQDSDQADSVTETFASLRLRINNPRWQDVPVTLRTGKALAEKRTDITLTFDDGNGQDNPNRFRFFIQPSEGIGIDVHVKQPGFDSRLETALMDFSYQRSFDETGHPDAYERVLVDAIRGDRTLFTTSDEVLTAWRIVQPVLNVWQRGGEGLKVYAKGTPIEQVHESA